MNMLGHQSSPQHKLYIYIYIYTHTCIYTYMYMYINLPHMSIPHNTTRGMGGDEDTPRPPATGTPYTTPHRIRRGTWGGPHPPIQRGCVSGIRGGEGHHTPHHTTSTGHHTPHRNYKGNPSRGMKPILIYIYIYTNTCISMYTYILIYREIDICIYN